MSTPKKTQRKDNLHFAYFLILLEAYTAQYFKIFIPQPEISQNMVCKNSAHAINTLRIKERKCATFSASKRLFLRLKACLLHRQ